MLPCRRWEVTKAAACYFWVSVQDSGQRSTPSFTVTAQLDFDKRFTWTVRAESGSAVGPWSATASFLSQNGGYILGNEVYDPLVNGKTVGDIHGSVTLIPGQGLRLNEEESYVQYSLPKTLVEGEFSVLVTGLKVVSSMPFISHSRAV